MGKGGRLWDCVCLLACLCVHQLATQLATHPATHPAAHPATPPSLSSPFGGCSVFVILIFYYLGSLAAIIICLCLIVLISWVLLAVQRYAVVSHPRHEIMAIRKPERIVPAFDWIAAAKAAMPTDKCQAVPRRLKHHAVNNSPGPWRSLFT